DPFNLRLNYKREKFWSVDPWELPVGEENECNYTFPDHDLLISLVDLYFEHVNVFTPVLHRPTFERSFAEGLHLKDRQFGAVVLLVCAVASRFSPDPRVLYNGTNSRYSAGYKWFQEVQIVDRHSLSAALTLYELQMYCLAVFFSHWTTTPLACWTIVGIGIRRAQDVGVHRRKVHRGKVDTVENELWKRGFWVLVVMDRYMSSALGRPCAMQDDEFDLDYPVECDDEFWLQDDPAQCFKQPPGRLSVITFFVLYVKLQQIIAMALRTVYSINIQVKVLRRLVGPDWQEKIVAELDSSLNEWTDLIPEQLRWDPSREINLFFNQSAMLYASYYHAQILIHRPFISPAKRNSSLALPSIVICTNAARSGSQVVGLHRQRSSELLPYIHMPIFTNGIVLLLYIWGNKRFGFPVGDVSRDWAAVRLCMDALRAEETRWQVAGRLWCVLFPFVCWIGW
ncbi:fungal-specific transcription factor domain-containing protein, partial [Sparassis latifolia]